MKLILPIKIYIFFIFFISSNLLEAQCIRPSFNFDSCDFVTIGHRGYSLVYPENTLIAIEEAFKRGVKYCEVDVSVTSDNKYILFHDNRAIHRTTNGSGKINEKSLAQIKELDAGSWKGPAFVGTKIPTLEEALLVAEKYDAHLFLDTKDFNLSLIIKALKNTGVREDRLVVYFNKLEAVNVFKDSLPNTPFVWYYGGDLPVDINDDKFYSDWIGLGCLAFEISSGTAIDSLGIVFTNKVHEHNGKVWTFTVNENEEIKMLKDLSYDGLETDRPYRVSQLVCNSEERPYPDSLVTGNWRFKQNLLSEGVGSQLRTKNYVNPPESLIPVFNTCSNFSISKLNGQDVSVMKIPAQDSSNGIFVYPNFNIQDYKNENQYFTIAMDILIPSISFGKYISIYQSNPKNSNDAELFIDPQGAIGIQGDYHGNLKANTWHRVVITVDNKKQILSKYIDGVFVGINSIFSNRWTILNNGAPGETQGFLLFTDNNDETADMYISSMQMRDYVLDSLSIKKMGGVKAEGFPLGDADLFSLIIEGAYADSTIMDYDEATYYVTVANGTDLSNVKVDFITSYRASSNIQSGSKLNLINGTFNIKVVSEDSLMQKNWKVCVKKANKTSIANNKEIDLTLRLFPNPVFEQLEFQIPSQPIGKWIISDVMGKKFLEGDYQNSKGQIETGKLIQGLYIFSLPNSPGNSQKFIKM